MGLTNFPSDLTTSLVLQKVSQSPYLCISYSVIPFTPKISLVILLTICHTVLVMLV